MLHIRFLKREYSKVICLFELHNAHDILQCSTWVDHIILSINVAISLRKHLITNPSTEYVNPSFEIQNITSISSGPWVEKEVALRVVDLASYHHAAS